MKTFAKFVALLVLATLCIVATAQQSANPPTSTDSSTMFSIRFKDGDNVTVTTQEKSLTVKTIYNGVLTVPCSDIVRIDFGVHFPDGVEKDILESVKKLGSDAHHVREKASRDLVNCGEFSYQLIKELVTKEEDDTERKRRLQGAMKDIVEKFPTHVLNVKTEDVIVTKTWTIIGKIDGKGLAIHHKSFGTTTLKFCELSTAIGIARNQDQKFVVDATRNGSSLDQWLDTSIVIRANTRVIITAEGQIDLWPQGPGQYTAVPKGYNTAGKGGQFMAGALIGRIGGKGKAFYIGNRFDEAINEEGPLFLLIVPSPWNNVSSGTYQVRIATSYVPK